MERIVNQAGQYYIPVSDRGKSTEWFVSVLGLSLDHNGHVMLPSGHCLFLIEVREAVLRERASSILPAVVFMIEDEDQFCLAMEEQGVRTVREEAPGTGQMTYRMGGPRYLRRRSARERRKYRNRAMHRFTRWIGN